ncbi:MAG: Ppx/GppA family phosphatase [Synergistaceae bacterium]|nr:Ppx/GppA family phosphatase [Synergistaceae bacterium]
MKAVVDIGSNSIKLRVARKKGSSVYTVFDTTEVVRLGKGLESGLLDEDTIEHGVDVVGKLVGLAEEMGTRPRLVGTMALRAARNAEDFVHRVRQRTGIAVEILSGEEEARLSWLGAIHGLDLGKKRKNVAVFDTGGGSTEFVLGSGSRIVKSTSVPVGAVRLTENFFDSDPVKPGAVESAREYIRGLFAAEGLFRQKLSPCVIGLGGGVAAIASVKLGLSSFIPEALNGALLTKDDVEEQVERYAGVSLDERMKIAGLPPKRADIVLGSACIVQCALEALKVDSFQVSINGLRHGLLVEMFGDGTLTPTKRVFRA